MFSKLVISATIAAVLGFVFSSPAPTYAAGPLDSVERLADKVGHDVRNSITSTLTFTPVQQQIKMMGRPFLTGTSFFAVTVWSGYSLYKTVTGWHMAALDIYDNATSPLFNSGRPVGQWSSSFGHRVISPVTSVNWSRVLGSFHDLQPKLDYTRFRSEWSSFKSRLPDIGRFNQPIVPTIHWNRITVDPVRNIDMGRFSSFRTGFDVDRFRSDWASFRDFKLPDVGRFTSPTLPTSPWRHLSPSRIYTPPSFNGY